MTKGEDFSRTLEGGSEALFDHECTKCRGNGSKQEATDFCQDCKQLLCNICRIQHVRYKKAHSLVSVASLQQSKTSLPTICPFPDAAKCQSHPDRDIEMYCGTHDMVYCCRCIAQEHRSCSDVNEIEDVAHTSNLSILQSLVAEFTRVSKQLHTTKLEMSNDLKLLQEMKGRLLDEIKALRKQYNEHLDDLEYKIIAELDKEENKLEKEIRDDITNVDELLIASDTDKPELTSHLDEKQIFMTEKLVQEALVVANNFLKNVPKHPTLKFEPNAILCDVIEQSDRMGKVNRIDTKQKRIQRSNYTLKNINTINVKVSSDKMWCCINDMCQLPDGTILLIDYNNNKLKRLDDQLNVKDFLDLFAEPNGLCSVSATEVAVRLCNSTIHIIYVGKSLTNKRTLSINKINNGGHGMACCNNQLWIPGDGAVYVHSPSGTLVKKIETDAQGQTIFPECNPRHIAVRGDEAKVYVAAGEDRVVVFNNNGDVLKKLRDQRLDDTWCICITDDDISLVAGDESKNVVMFDRDGNSLGELVTSKDMLADPCSMYYDSKRCRLFAGYSSDNAQIFQLS